MIPKRAIFFWGNDKMSWLRYMTLYTFCKWNPNWKIQLYTREQNKTEKYWDTPEQQDFFCYTGSNYFERLQDLNIEVISWKLDHKLNDEMGPSHVSNLFKWQQLAEEGGVYLDMDILFVKSIEDWYTKVEESDAILCYAPERYFSIGLLGSSGDNAFYRLVFDECIKTFFGGVYQSMGVMVLYQMFGPMRQLDHWGRLQNSFSELVFQNFSMEYVYPWMCTQMQEVFGVRHVELPVNTFGIHWYAGTEIAQRYNVLMDGEDWHKYDNTFSYQLAKILERVK